MKKLAYILGALLSLTLVCTAFADDTVKLNIDGKSVETDVPPQIIDGRTMVPVRAIFEGVGATVNWNGDTKTITGSMLGIDVVMVLDSNVVNVDSSEITMDCAPVIIDGRTLAPARYVAEAFGCNVEWDGENRVVNIATPVHSLLAETTTVAATVTIEATTETTTFETTTNPMESFDTYYKPGTYIVGSDIPAGDYVIYANPGKLGYINYYTYTNGTNTSSLQNGHFDYCTVVRAASGNRLQLSNAYAIPQKDTKADISHNGTFRAGKDIKSGHLTFKLAEGVGSAYVEVGVEGMPQSTKTIEYLNKDNTSLIINVRSGDYVKMVGCDVYDEMLKPIAKHKLVTENSNHTDANINFSEITPSLKKTIDDYLTGLSTNYNANNLNGNLYSDVQFKTVTGNWNKLAKNSADRKYIELAKNIYDNIRVIAKDTKTSIAFADAISMFGKEITGIKYRHNIDGEKDMVTNAINKFKSAADFMTLETTNENVRNYRWQVPRLTGYKIR